jgi:hypothetical protein
MKKPKKSQQQKTQPKQKDKRKMKTMPAKAAEDLPLEPAQPETQDLPPSPVGPAPEPAPEPGPEPTEKELAAARQKLLN